MQRIIRKHGVVYHKYADDTQLYVTYNPNVLGGVLRAVKQLEYCIAEIRWWMINRVFKLNDNKDSCAHAPAPATFRNLLQLISIPNYISDSIS